MFDRTVEGIGETQTFSSSTSNFYANAGSYGTASPTGNTGPEYFRKLGTRELEMSNHLGNVQTVVSDKKIPLETTGDNIVDYCIAEILNTNDYYAFGQAIPGRSFVSVTGAYRYGFNGKENDAETVGTGNGAQDYGMRIYNPALGKFLSVDPLCKAYAWSSTYAFSENDVISNVDLDGLEKFYSADGNLIGSIGNSTEHITIPNENKARALFWIHAANHPPVNADKQYSGRAAGYAIKYGYISFNFGTLVKRNTDTEVKYSGYELKGRKDVDDGFSKASAEGNLTGFNAEGNIEHTATSVDASAKVYGLNAKGSVRFGSESNNVAVATEGNVFMAEANFKAGAFTGENGKYGMIVGGDAGAYALQGEVNPSFSFFGIKATFTIGGSAGSAQIGGGLGTIYDKNKGTVSTMGMFKVGLLGGFKLGVKTEIKIK